jgi:hypothetical protein
MPVILKTMGNLKYDTNPGQPKQKIKPCLQNDQRKRAGVVAQVMESLPSKCETLSLNAKITKKNLSFLQKEQMMYIKYNGMS